MITFLLYLLVIGVVAGYLARLLVPGRDPMGFGSTVLLGIAGSLIGGTAGALIFSGRLIVTPGGTMASVIGAIIALLLYRATASRAATHSQDRAL